jgi:hypothetical protein
LAALPRAHEALVERRKLVDYVLCPTHNDGRHKARVFRALLGIEQQHWEYLREQLLDGLLEATQANIKTTPHGVLGEVLMPIEGLNGSRQIVTTVWEMHDESPRPRLVSAYIQRKHFA